MSQPVPARSVTTLRASIRLRNAREHKRRLPASECWRARRASLARDPAGTSSERLQDRALRGLAQEQWGPSSPEHRSDSYGAPADEQLATKADLATLRSELAGDIQTTIDGLERRLIGYLVAAVVIVLGAIRYP